MEDLMYVNEQPDSTGTNHIDCIKPSTDTGESDVNSVHENSMNNSIPDVVKVTHHQDDRLRSDSFSDEWQDFTTSVSDGPQGVPLSDNTTLDSSKDNNGSTASENVDFVSLSKTVLRQCFTCDNHDHSLSHNDDFDCQDDFWKELVDHVMPIRWSCEQAEDHMLMCLHDRRKKVSRCSSSRVSISPDSDLSYFDWSEDAVCPMLLELRMGNLDVDSTSYVYSMQISPIELEFDHDKAALGLSILSVEELTAMQDEMAEKFSSLSDDLIKELQQRDILVRDQEVRNQFVAMLMKVEGKKKAVSKAKAQAAANSSSSGKRLVLKAKNLRKRNSEDITNQCKFLDTVIPYVPPSNSEWRTETLQTLTKLLSAVHDDSPTLAGLTSDYLSTEVFNFPSTDLDNDT